MHSDLSFTRKARRCGGKEGVTCSTGDTTGLGVGQGAPYMRKGRREMTIMMALTLFIQIYSCAMQSFGFNAGMGVYNSVGHTSGRVHELGKLA